MHIVGVSVARPDELDAAIEQLLAAIAEEPVPDRISVLADQLAKTLKRREAVENG